MELRLHVSLWQAHRKINFLLHCGVRQNKIYITFTRQTDRNVLRVVKTALLCVRGSRCSEKQTQKYEVCNTFFVFIAIDHFGNKFYCRLHSDQLERQYRGPGRNRELLKAKRVQTISTYSVIWSLYSPQNDAVYICRAILEHSYVFFNKITGNIRN